jgi:hypothetical protein
MKKSYILSAFILLLGITETTHIQAINSTMMAQTKKCKKGKVLNSHNKCVNQDKKKEKAHKKHNSNSTDTDSDSSIDNGIVYYDDVNVAEAPSYSTGTLSYSTLGTDSGSFVDTDFSDEVVIQKKKKAPKPQTAPTTSIFITNDCKTPNSTAYSPCNIKILAFNEAGAIINGDGQIINPGETKEIKDSPAKITIKCWMETKTDGLRQENTNLNNKRINLEKPYIIITNYPTGTVQDWNSFNSTFKMLDKTTGAEYTF